MGRAGARAQEATGLGPGSCRRTRRAWTANVGFGAERGRREEKAPRAPRPFCPALGPLSWA